MALGDETKEKLERKKAGLYALGLSIGSDLENKARSGAPWTDRTGDTRRKINGGAEKSSNGVIVYLAHGSKVGLFMEEGTNPHVIRPKNKKALRFVVNGKEIFTKKVNHPGIAPRPIVRPTVESNFPKIKQQVRRYWEGS